MENNVKILLDETKYYNELLHKQLLELRSTKWNITSRLYLFIDEINKIFSEIKKCHNEEEAGSYFKILEDIQGMVSILISEDTIQVPDELWKLYKDFDHLDRKEDRVYLFNEIKNDRYSLI